MRYLRVSSPNDYREEIDFDYEELFRQKILLLWKEGCLVDVTLACEDELLTAHKLVLSAYSDYFKDIFTSVRSQNHHPIVFMRDIPGDVMKSILEFMYCGEVNVTEQHLNAFIKTARILKIKGLSILEDDNINPLGDHQMKRKRDAEKQWTSPPKRIKSKRFYDINSFVDDDQESPLTSLNSDDPKYKSLGVGHYQRTVRDAAVSLSNKTSADKKSEALSQIPDLYDSSSSSESDILDVCSGDENNASLKQVFSKRENKKDSTKLLEASPKAQASNSGNIPLSSKQTKISKKTKPKQKQNDSTIKVLSSENEEKLMQFIDYTSQIMPLTAHQVKCLAFGIDIILGSKKFGPRGPSKSWFTSLKRRNPKLLKVLRNFDFLNANHMRSISLSLGQLSDFLIPLQEILTAFDLNDKADHLWSCSDYSVNFTNPFQVGLHPSRERFISAINFSPEDKYMSVMLASSPSGKLMSPFMVFQDLLPTLESKNEGLVTAMYDKNKSGFMDSDMMLKWFVHTFLPQCPQDRSEDTPVVLLLNSSFAIAPPKMLDIASKEHVILLSLMPHLQHSLEPLDHLIVHEIRNFFVQGSNQDNNPSPETLRNAIPRLMKESMEKGVKSDLVVDGFCICGIFPPSVRIDQDAYLELRQLLNFDQLTLSLLDNETPNSNPGTVNIKEKRDTKKVPEQNYMHTSDESVDSALCYACGDKLLGQDKGKQCSKKTCKNVSCEECLPVLFDREADYVCIDCKC